MNNESDSPIEAGESFEDAGTTESDADGDAEGPRRFDAPAYRALREGDNDRFQQLTEGMEEIDYSFANLGGVDLRKVDISRVILRGARLKGADLRGLDLSGHDLDGASLNGARISGVLFPRTRSADEILMSVERGTRIRQRSEAQAKDEN